MLFDNFSPLQTQVNPDRRNLRYGTDGANNPSDQCPGKIEKAKVTKKPVERSASVEQHSAERSTHGRANALRYLCVTSAMIYSSYRAYRAEDWELRTGN